MTNQSKLLNITFAWCFSLSSVLLIEFEDFLKFRVLDALRSETTRAEFNCLNIHTIVSNTLISFGLASHPIANV